MKGRPGLLIFFSILFTFHFSLPCPAASQWEQMVLYSSERGVFYKTTSELDNPEPDPFNPGIFSGVRVFDGDRNTCWAEGVPGNGSGEALFFTIPENIGILHIINGSAGSEIEADVGSPVDTVHYILRLEIQDVYKGLETEDTCLAEIRIEEGFESIRFIYLSEDESSVLMDTDKKTGVIVDRDKEAVFQIINHTEDNQWLICIKMPRKNEGRVETEYVLYNTAAAKKIEKETLGEHVLDIYGFVKKDGKIFLEYFNSSTSKIEYLDLDEIKLK